MVLLLFATGLLNSARLLIRSTVALQKVTGGIDAIPSESPMRIYAYVGGSWSPALPVISRLQRSRMQSCFELRSHAHEEASSLKEKRSWELHHCVLTSSLGRLRPLDQPDTCGLTSVCFWEHPRMCREAYIHLLWFLTARWAGNLSVNSIYSLFAVAKVTAPMETTQSKREAPRKAF